MPSPSPVRSGLLLLLALMGVAVLWLARDVVQLAFFAVILAVVFSFPVDLLARVMPRGLGVLVVLTGLLGLMVGVSWAVVPAVRGQAEDLVSRAPAAMAKARRWLEHAQGAGPAAGKAAQVEQKVEAQAAHVAEVGLGKAVPVALTAASLATTFVLVLVLALFLVYQPHLYKRGLRGFVPRPAEEVFDEAWRRLGEGLRRWVGGIVVSMALMGALTGVGLAVAGIKGWLVLALLTFFATFIPYLGALSSAVPGLLMGLSQDPRHFFYAAAVYLGVHVAEGYIVEPLVMRRAVQLRPAALLLGQAFFFAVFGVLGAVVATPALVAGKILLEYLYVERRLGKSPG